MRERLRVADFDYELPAAAIAQTPAEPRDASRLLVLDRAASHPRRPALQHAVFREVGEWLRPGDLLVVNDSRVIPARLRGTRNAGGGVELLLLRSLSERRWEALVRPSRRVRVGEPITLAGGETVTVGERLESSARAVDFARDPMAVLAAAGETPLPPYITDRSTPPDRYQTVYARPPGSAAAPTAGLHFTPELLARLQRDGIRRATLTLHVGLDTFQPLEGELIDEHQIHTEWYRAPADLVARVGDARRTGGRSVAVGTTSVRVLETLADARQTSGWTGLYVTPPHRFAHVDAMITNFHLPRSSLLVLVTAFVQDGMPGASGLQARDTLLAAYEAALERGYRFFSFGDAMLIL